MACRAWSTWPRVTELVQPVEHDLVLCSGTLRRDATFGERLEAARAGGFTGISLWGRDYNAARTEGLSDADLRKMLDDNGIFVAEVDPAWWWLPGASEVRIPRKLDDQDVFCFEEKDLFAIADAVGARSINAVDVFGGRFTLEQASEAFAAFSRRAAEHGLRVQLEFMPWSKIPDLRTAWQVVRDAGVDNGGIVIDSWHYFRGTPDAGLLETIPGDRIFGVQLSDAPAEPEPELIKATLHHRLLPGDGELDLASLLAGLRSIKTAAPIGVEVFSDSLHELPAVVAGRRAGESMRRVLSQPRSTS
jgi:sugar phosphate isomerase/epimerase